MKSNKQRRTEIKGQRSVRAARIGQALPSGRAVCAADRVMADRSVLALHNNTCGPLPTFYVSHTYHCRDCGVECVWTAQQQKWWFENLHGSVGSRAVRCLACRRTRHAQREVPGADLLGQECRRLRALGGCKPTAEALAQIDLALRHKWWGLRVVAIQALGRWGGAEHIARLNALVAERPIGSSRYYRSWERIGTDEAATALVRGNCVA